MPTRTYHVLPLALGLAACVSSSEVERSPHATLARALLDSARNQRVDYIASQLAPSLQAVPGITDSIGAALRFLPAAPWDSVRLIGFNITSMQRARRSSLTYEVHGASGWSLANVGVDEDSGPPAVFSFRTQSLTRSLEAANAFALSGKSIGNYAMLVAAGVSLAFSLVVAALAVRSRLPRRWLWALFALLGSSDVLLNWTTGQIGSKLISVRFPTVGFSRVSPAAPWILAVAFPIGAVVVLYRLQRLRRPPPDPDPGTV